MENTNVERYKEHLDTWYRYMYHVKKARLGKKMNGGFNAAFSASCVESVARCLAGGKPVCSGNLHFAYNSVTGHLWLYALRTPQSFFDVYRNRDGSEELSASWKKRGAPDAERAFFASLYAMDAVASVVRRCGSAAENVSTHAPTTLFGAGVLSFESIVQGTQDAPGAEPVQFSAEPAMEPAMEPVEFRDFVSVPSIPWKRFAEKDKYRGAYDMSDAKAMRRAELLADFYRMEMREKGESFIFGAEAVSGKNAHGPDNRLIQVKKRALDTGEFYTGPQGIICGDIDMAVAVKDGDGVVISLVEGKSSDNATVGTAQAVVYKLLKQCFARAENASAKDAFGNRISWGGMHIANTRTGKLDHTPILDTSAAFVPYIAKEFLSAAGAAGTDAMKEGALHIQGAVPNVRAYAEHQGVPASVECLEARFMRRLCLDAGMTDEKRRAVMFEVVPELERKYGLAAILGEHGAARAAEELAAIMAGARGEEGVEKRVRNAPIPTASPASPWDR